MVPPERVSFPVTWSGPHLSVKTSSDLNRPPSLAWVLGPVVLLVLAVTWAANTIAEVGMASFFSMSALVGVLPLMAVRWNETRAPRDRISVGVDGVYARGRLWRFPLEFDKGRDASTLSPMLILRAGDAQEVLHFERILDRVEFEEAILVRASWNEEARRTDHSEAGYREARHPASPLVRVLEATDDDVQQEALLALEPAARTRLKRAIAKP